MISECANAEKVSLIFNSEESNRCLWTTRRGTLPEGVVGGRGCGGGGTKWIWDVSGMGARGMARIFDFGWDISKECPARRRSNEGKYDVVESRMMVQEEGGNRERRDRKKEIRKYAKNFGWQQPKGEM